MPKKMKIHGFPIRDAKSDLEVEISTSDVRKAGVKDPSSCAMAQAICRDHEYREARVHLSVTYARKAGQKEWLRFMTPCHLRTEIIAFDRGGKFQPGIFVLRKPTKVSGKQQGSATNQTAPKHMRRRGPKETRQYVIAGVRPNANSEFDPKPGGKS